VFDWSMTTDKKIAIQEQGQSRVTLTPTDSKPPSLVRVDSDEDGEDALQCPNPVGTSSPNILDTRAKIRIVWEKIWPRFKQLLASYVKFMNTAINQDKGIKFLQYTLWLVSKAYSKDSHQRSELNKVSLELSFVRYATRLLLFPTALEATFNNSWTTPSKSHPRIFQSLGSIMAWSMAYYYPTEHAAYLHWKAPKLMRATDRSGNRWSAWSCRAWAAFIVADLAKGALQWREIRQEQRILKQEEGEDQVSTEAQSASTASLRQVQLQISRNALFLLPAVQWALPNWDTDPWLSPDLINFLLWLESVVCLYQASV